MHKRRNVELKKSQSYGTYPESKDRVYIPKIGKFTLLISLEQTINLLHKRRNIESQLYDPENKD